MNSTHNSETPVLKRKRVEPVDGAALLETNDVTAELQPTRDDQFYLENQEANCVIRAGDILFKAHRFILAKDSSAFRDMFKRTRIGSAAEGCSDENPIILPESPEDIRALLWVLYALPGELHLQQGAGGDLGRLLIIARMTHKYQFATTETWALDIIPSVILTSPTFWTNSSGPISVLEVAVLCNCKTLHDLIMDHWVPKIISRELPPMPALLAGDKYQIKSLQGAAYYALLFSGTDGNILSSSKIPPELNKDQRARLISGYWRIATIKAVQLEPISFPGSDTCYRHDASCVVAWRSHWGQHVDLKTAKLDFLGRLVYIHKHLAEDQTLERDSSTGFKKKGGSGSSHTMGMTSSCRTAALSKLQRIIDEHTMGLSVYFEDLTVPSST